MWRAQNTATNARDTALVLVNPEMALLPESGIADVNPATLRRPELLDCTATKAVDLKRALGPSSVRRSAPVERTDAVSGRERRIYSNGFQT